MSLSPVVSLLTCTDSSREQIATAIDQLLAPLALPDFHGSRVLLKPNLISTTGPALASTAAEFAAGAALWFREQGAQVALGDSPAFGTARLVCNRHGLTEALQGMDVEIVEFRRAVSTRLACGERLPIAAAALECDWLVGLPRLKAHQQMYVTMALKNLFGVVRGMSKAMLHMKQGGEGAHDRFARIIFDLHRLFPAQLHLLDARVAMHRSGPINGEAMSLGVVAASQSPVALESVMLELLGLPADNAPLWRVARELDWPGWKVEEVAFPLLRPEAFDLPEFVAPRHLNPVRFRLFRYFRSMGRRLLREPLRR